MKCPTPSQNFVPAAHGQFEDVVRRLKLTGKRDVEW
jgi:hypothetical protein